MSRMSDIMEMVKQGYSVKEIKEVFELGKEIETEETPKEETDPAGGIQEQDPGKDPEQDPPADNPQPDLKYQELENKYNDLLKKYQQTNVRQDISGNNEEKSVEEAARDVLAAMIGG
jgi:chromatin segregation and condensation protein Rec8/ScpA/Scc1 (kleisin family)